MLANLHQQLAQVVRRPLHACEYKMPFITPFLPACIFCYSRDCLCLQVGSDYKSSCRQVYAIVYHSICQSSVTKVSFFMDNMVFDTSVMASYLRDLLPSASLFSLIKFRLVGHS